MNTIDFTEKTYKQGFKSIGKGIAIILSLIPKTFSRQTKALVLNHPIYLATFIAVMAFQLYTIAQERINRDASSNEIWELQHKLDSINNKQVKFYSYK